MSKPEKNPKEKAKDDEKSIVEENSENQEMDTSLGFELLDRELRRQEAAREFVAKYHSKKEKHEEKGED